MKKFRFRLQKVMEVKEEVEKQRMLELVEAKKCVSQEKEELERLQIRNRECWEKIEERKTEDRINPVEMNLYYCYLRKLGNEIDLQNNRVQDAENEMEKRRRILLDASKERKILEKLKERKYTAYRSEMLKMEQDFFDDIANTKHSRGRESRDF